MGKVIGQEEKKRPVTFLLDEIDGFFSVTFGECSLIGRSLDYLFIPHQRNMPVFDLWIAESPRFIGVDSVMVIAVGDPIIIVESVPCGEELREVAEVPLSDTCGCIV